MLLIDARVETLREGSAGDVRLGGTRRTLESLFRDRALMQQTVEWFAPLAVGKASPDGRG